MDVLKIPIRPGESVRLDEGVGVVLLSSDVNASYIESGSVVADGRAAGSTEKIEQLSQFRCPPFCTFVRGRHCLKFQQSQPAPSRAVPVLFKVFFHLGVEFDFAQGDEATVQIKPEAFAG